MSIPHDILHQIAETHKPDLPIKERSTWVGILRHDKYAVENIKEENDFMWLKCHGRITTKTLKHFYFSRYPIEDFMLRHKDYWPVDGTTVAKLRKREDYEDNVVVLQAIDLEDVEMYNDADLAQQVRTGNTVDNAITIDDEDDDVEAVESGPERHSPRVQAYEDINDDDEGEKEDEHDVTLGNRSTSVTTATDQASPRARVLTPRTSSSPDAPSRKRGYSESESGSDEASIQLLRETAESAAVHVASPAPDFSSASLALSPVRDNTPVGYEYINGNYEQEMDFDYTPDFMTSEAVEKRVASLEERIAILPEPQRSNVRRLAWHNCEVPHCGKRFHIKPWTQFGPMEHGALCTRCSRIWLEENHDYDALNLMNQQMFSDLGANVPNHSTNHFEDMDADHHFGHQSSNNSMPTSSGYGGVAYQPAPHGYGPLKPNPTVLNTSAADHSDNSMSTVTPRSFSAVIADINTDSSYPEDDFVMIDDEDMLSQVDRNIGHSKMATNREQLPVLSSTFQPKQKHQLVRSIHGTQEDTEDEESDDEAEPLVDAAAGPDDDSDGDYFPED